jgi:hypothetical protein
LITKVFVAPAEAVTMADRLRHDLPGIFSSVAGVIPAILPEIGSR